MSEPHLGRIPVSCSLPTHGGLVVTTHPMGGDIFTFKNHELRTIELDGEPWFVAKDVCLCLGLVLGTSGVSNQMKKVEEDERRVLRRTDLTLTHRMREFPFHPRENWLTFTNESGLYKLIMRSDKPEAREFQNWVTREVLPSIRKTGGYLSSEQATEGEQTPVLFCPINPPYRREEPPKLRLTTMS